MAPSATTSMKNPVACAAALATIAYIEEERLVERARAMGGYALDRLCAMAARHDAIRAVRGLGLLLGMELDDAARAERVMYRSLAGGLSFKVTMGRVLTLTPPLTVSREEMDLALEILDRALAAG